MQLRAGWGRQRAGGRHLHGRGEGPLHSRGFPWEPKSPRAAKREVPAFLGTKTVREVVPPRPRLAPDGPAPLATFGVFLSPTPVLVLEGGVART